MLTLLKKIAPINKIQTIGIQNNDLETSFYLIKTSKKSNDLLINETNSYENIELLLDNLDKKIPIIINITGRGVLNKKIDFENEQDVNWFSNLDLNNLSYFKLNIDKTSFISITKKDEIQKWLSFFKMKKYSVLDCYVGSFVSYLLHYTQTSNTIQTNELMLHLENGLLKSFSKSEENDTKSFLVGEFNLDYKYTSAFCSVLNFYIKDNLFEKSDAYNTDYESYIYNKTFSVLGKFTLIFYFSLLLISYLGISYLTKKNNELNYQNYFMINTLNKYEHLEKLKVNKLKILNEIGAYSSKYFSHYITEIINTTNKNINFNELEINGLENEIKENKKIFFSSNQINIQGTSIDENHFNTWIEQVKNLNFINKIKIEKMFSNKEGKIEFEIKITLSNV